MPELKTREDLDVWLVSRLQKLTASSSPQSAARCVSGDISGTWKTPKSNTVNSCASEAKEAKDAEQPMTIKLCENEKVDTPKVKKKEKKKSSVEERCSSNNSNSSCSTSTSTIDNEDKNGEKEPKTTLAGLLLEKRESSTKKADEVVENEEEVFLTPQEEEIKQNIANFLLTEEIKKLIENGEIKETTNDVKTNGHSLPKQGAIPENEEEKEEEVEKGFSISGEKTTAADTETQTLSPSQKTTITQTTKTETTTIRVEKRAAAKNNKKQNLDVSTNEEEKEVEAEEGISKNEKGEKEAQAKGGERDRHHKYEDNSGCKTVLSLEEAMVIKRFVIEQERQRSNEKAATAGETTNTAAAPPPETAPTKRAGKKPKNKEHVNTKATEELEKEGALQIEDRIIARELKQQGKQVEENSESKDENSEFNAKEAQHLVEGEKSNNTLGEDVPSGQSSLKDEATLPAALNGNESTTSNQPETIPKLQDGQRDRLAKDHRGEEQASEQQASEEQQAAEKQQIKQAEDTSKTVLSLEEAMVMKKFIIETDGKRVVAKTEMQNRTMQSQETSQNTTSARGEAKTAEQNIAKEPTNHTATKVQNKRKKQNKSKDVEEVKEIIGVDKVTEKQVEKEKGKQLAAKNAIDSNNDDNNEENQMMDQDEIQKEKLAAQAKSHALEIEDKLIAREMSQKEGGRSQQNETEEGEAEDTRDMTKKETQEKQTEVEQLSSSPKTKGNDKRNEVCEETIEECKKVVIIGESCVILNRPAVFFGSIHAPETFLPVCTCSPFINENEIKIEYEHTQKLWKIRARPLSLGLYVIDICFKEMQDTSPKNTDSEEVVMQKGKEENTSESQESDLNNCVQYEVTVKPNENEEQEFNCRLLELQQQELNKYKLQTDIMTREMMKMKKQIRDVAYYNLFDEEEKKQEAISLLKQKNICEKIIQSICLECKRHNELDVLPEIEELKKQYPGWYSSYLSTSKLTENDIVFALHRIHEIDLRIANEQMQRLTKEEKESFLALDPACLRLIEYAQRLSC